MALAQALESQDNALIEREENKAYQKHLNAGIDYALVTLMPSFLSELEIYKIIISCLSTMKYE